MWGLDLNRFRFNESMTWAVFLMNADGAIYARYGSCTGVQEPSTRDVSPKGSKATLQAAIRLHDEYGKDEEGVGRALAGNTGPKREYRSGTELFKSSVQLQYSRSRSALTVAASALPVCSRPLCDCSLRTAASTASV